MPELLILRHAKSDWGDASLRDFDRPLNKRGRKTAPEMGKVISAIGRIDHVVASPAKRVVETLEGVSSTCSLPDIEFDPALYGASTQELMTALRAIPDGTERALIAGHNPGLHWLAMALTEDDHSAYVLDEKFPTAALAHIAFDGDWSALNSGSGRLLDFVRPSDL